MRRQRPVPVFCLVGDFDKLDDLSIAFAVISALVRRERAPNVSLGRVNIPFRRCRPDLGPSAWVLET